MLLTLLLMGWVFGKVVLNYQERTSLEGVSRYYAEQGPRELGAPNLVTAVVVTYRGLDTLGEVTVLFISAAGVGLMLRRREKRPSEEPPSHASEIVETASRLLEPLVVLLGIYVFLNGHLSPGGGFPGGAIMASGTVLLLLALPETSLSRRLISWTESVSGFAYVLIGVLGVVLAGGFLDNRILGLGEYGHLLSAGAIPLIYLFIGLKVGSELSAVLDKFRG